MRHSEHPLSALWRSAATEIVSARLGGGGKGAATDTSHPWLAGVEAHLAAYEAGRELARPPSGGDPDDTAVAAYLSHLHHRLAHARLDGDAALAADLARQRDEFTYGDPAWEQMAVLYLAYYGRYLGHRPGRPRYRAAGDDPDFGVIEWRLPARARLAIVGDVGTGTDTAATVLLAALSLRPDAILHLGDVYYSGTDFEFAHRYTGLLEAVMARAGDPVPVFGVPGNHEYFTGAHAYLDCLDSGRLAPEPGQRQHASFFCLRSADDGWQFLGLDTGYHGHALGMPPQMLADALRELHAADPNVPDDVAPLSLLPDAGAAGQVMLREDERRWHADKLTRFPGRSVLLSHHQLYSAVQRCGPDPAPDDPADPRRPWVNSALWAQLGEHFGDRVAAWLWGHEHNLGVFADGYRPAGWPAQDDAASAGWQRTLPKGRCLGHAAIPVAAKEQPYATTYPVPLADPRTRLAADGGWYRRGFGLLELAGQGAALTARYYQVSGVDPAPQHMYAETIA
jgi:hypothetical protein